MIILKVWILWYYIAGILKCYTQLDVVQKTIHSFSELLILKYANLWFSKSYFDSAQSGTKHLEGCVKDWHEFGAATVTWTVSISQNHNPKIMNKAYVLKRETFGNI